MQRSLEPIIADDLLRLSELARADRKAMFKHNEHWRAYEGQVLGVTLCQGSALHYVDGVNGVKDFDVWSSSRRRLPGHIRIPPCTGANKPADFEESRFGRTASAPAWIKGRRVDLLARSFPVARSADPIEAIQQWLRSGNTKSARKLADKAVVMLEPALGQVIWPPG